ncbi:MAG: hypothetical protein ACXADL_13935 [Candidatus Thorarchaeota archaeon]|jgi:hypothetical protein
MGYKQIPLHELVETIRSFLKNNESYQQTAIELGEHRGTVWNRLKSKRAKRIIERARIDPTELDMMQQEVEEILFQQYSHIAALEKQVASLADYRKVHVSAIEGDWINVGVVSDVHKGSLYHQSGLLELAYDTFEKEGIRDVYSPGDLLAGGKMYRGQEFELWAHGVDAQVDLLCNTWPEKDGITTHFITGNHDLSFYKQVGVDVGKRIPVHRPDFNYLGREEADVHFETSSGKARMRLVHPSKGTAYALSYQPQKYIEALEGGKKPHVILMGHYHKAEKIPNYRNIYLIQSGCIEGQTPFMRRMNISAHCGFWILRFKINETQLVSRFKSEFVSWFGKQD